VTPSERSDLTYGEFTKRRAAALARLHGAQALQARITDTRYTSLTADAIATVNQAVSEAKENLAQVLDAWARSSFNRSV
jgi:(p)ppGpp synthase/HD superfamily hydrolase